MGCELKNINQLTFHEDFIMHDKIITQNGKGK